MNIMKLSPFSDSRTISILTTLLTGEEVSHLVDYYVKQFTYEETHRGTAQTCKYYKELYAQAIHIACKVPFVPLSFRKSNSKGEAKGLYPFLTYLKGSPAQKRAALTVLRLVNLVHLSPQVDTKSITTDQIKDWGKRRWDHFEKWLHKPGKKGLSRIMLARFPKPSVTDSWVIPRAVSGPNGPSSLWTSPYDALAIAGNEELTKSIAYCSGKPEQFYEWIHFVADWARKLKPLAKPLRTSRLVGLSEGAGKTRVIALGDLMSQAALKPFHDLIMERLRMLVTDGTWDQNHVIQRVKDMTLSHAPLFSFDLTAATDRFPLKFKNL